MAFDPTIYGKMWMPETREAQTMSSKALRDAVMAEREACARLLDAHKKIYAESGTDADIDKATLCDTLAFFIRSR